VPPTPPIRAARGVRDVLPAERAAHAVVERAAHDMARRFGYQEVEVPIIEPVELIERGVGNDSDAGGKELYRLQSQQDADGEAGARLVLRPEATASMVRAYFQGGLNQASQPVRLFTVGPMFRHDKPQHLRFRQFSQFDVEVIGDPSPAYDVEVIEMTWRWLEEMGIEHVSLHLNSIGDASCRPQYLQALRDYYRPLKGRLHSECQRRVEENPLRLFDCKEPQCLPFRAGAPRITDHLCGPCAAAFEQVRTMLDAAGLEHRLDPYLVRGLDYYTRTVFELQHESLGGAQNALGGGGRYDGLAAGLGYADTPGVGFAGGIDRVAHILQGEPGAVEAPSVADVLVLPMGDGLDGAAARVGRICRAAVRTAVDYSGRSLRAKMKTADKSGARWAAIMDAAEAERQVVQLRDLASGEQREVPWGALPEAFAAAEARR
jgi:histidyl-tRNA synthetase